MDAAVRETWQHIKERDFAGARAHARLIEPFGRRANALHHIRLAQAQEIRALWRYAYTFGLYAPAEELARDLGNPEEVPDGELDRIYAAIIWRMSTRDGELPHGWEWAERWRGRHPDGRETAIYLEKADALREMRRQMTEQERQREQRQRSKPRPAADNDDELFPEERERASG